MPQMEKEIETAVRWWSDSLQGRGPAKYNNGDTSNIGFMMMALATMAADAAPVAANQYTAFEASLRRLLTEAAEAGRTTINLMTDYGPGGLLADAMEEAKVSFDKAPWKTYMTVEQDQVTVSAGYRAPTETLYIVARAEMRFLDYENHEGREVTKQYINVARAVNDAANALRYRDERAGRYYRLPLGGKNLETGEDLTPAAILAFYETEILAKRLKDYDGWADQERAQKFRDEEAQEGAAAIAAYRAATPELIGERTQP